MLVDNLYNTWNNDNINDFWVNKNISDCSSIYKIQSISLKPLNKHHIYSTYSENSTKYNNINTMTSININKINNNINKKLNNNNNRNKTANNHGTYSKGKLTKRNS